MASHSKPTRALTAPRVLSSALFVALVSGCSSWQATPLTPPAPVASSVGPAPIKIRTADGRKVTVQNWTLDADTLRGTREIWVDYEPTQQPWAHAIEGVSLQDGSLEGAALRAELESRLRQAAARGMVVVVPSKPEALPERLRVRFADGSMVVLLHPRVDGDTLRGTVQPMTPPPGPEAAFALKDVSSAEAHRSKPVATISLILLAGAIVIGILAAEGFSEMR